MKGAFWNSHFPRKIFSFLILATNLIVILFGVCDRASMIPKTPSTNLENESINGLKLLDSKIVRISTPSKDSSFQTPKGISIAASRDEIIQTYGKNQYECSDELGYKVLGYVEKEKQQTIEFFFTVEEGKLDHKNLDLLEVN